MFILGKKKMHHLGSDVDRKGNYAYVEAGDIWAIFVLHLNFIVKCSPPKKALIKRHKRNSGWVC